MRADLVEVPSEASQPRHHVPQRRGSLPSGARVVVARARTSDGDFSSDRHSCQRGCRVARQPQPSSARCVRWHRVRHTEPRSVRCAVGAVHEPLHRLVAVHARASRHPLRAARLPLEAVGIGRALGRHRRVRAASLGCRHDARQRPSASLRDRRRELPRRLHGMGVRARARRRHLEDPSRPELDGCTGVRLLPRRGVPPLARAGSAARTASPGRARWPARRSGSTRTRDGTTGSCSSSTSSIRTSRSTRPTTYASLYDPDWEGPHLVHPPYMVGAIDRGEMTERQGRQVRACYGAKLTMIDHWFGRVLEALDRNGLADTTAVIVCTDHGHYLGDRRLVGHDGAATDIWGKPGVPVFEPMGHIPLMVRVPGVAASDCDALTTSVDLCATIADLFDVVLRQRTSGRSLLPLVRGEATSIRDWALTGVWGREVHVVDRRATYARGPVGDNAPLSMWSNRWSTMPTRALSRRDELPMPDDRARARPHARFRHPGDPPAVRRGRPSAVLGARPGSRATTCTTAATIPTRSTTSPALGARPRWPSSSASRCSRWKRHPISSSAWASPEVPFARVFSRTHGALALNTGPAAGAPVASTPSRALGAVWLAHLPYKEGVGGSNPSAPTKTRDPSSPLLRSIRQAISRSTRSAPRPAILR